VAREGILLTEAQVAALERKQEDDVACGEIETAHPGYLGSQDTLYVGTLKGVGRVYQQTFVDTYAKVAFAKLYTTKTPITRRTCSTTGYCPSLNPRDCRCCGCSRTVAPSIAARQTAMTMSCIWPSTTLSTPKPRRGRRRPMAYASAFIKPFCKNFIR
jgi:hypothetical protein